MYYTFFAVFPITLCRRGLPKYRIFKPNITKRKDDLMKNTVLLIILGLTVISLLSGCGKSEKDLAKEYYQEELGLTEEEADEVADFVFSDSEFTGDSDETEEDADIEKELEHFPVSPEWKNHDISDYVIQIDDSLYETGILVADFMKIVEASAANYTYEYNPDKLVNKGDGNTVIDVYREGELWFTVETWNFFGGTISLAEIPVKRIVLQDKTYEYCYFIDGRSYEDIMQMKYKDILALMDNEFVYENFKDVTTTTLKYYYSDNNMDTTTIEENWGEKGGISAHYWTLKYNETERPNIPNSLSCGYSMPQKYSPDKAYLNTFDDTEQNYCYLDSSETYTFIVDKDTTEMVKFEISLTSGSGKYNVDPALME